MMKQHLRTIATLLALASPAAAQEVVMCQSPWQDVGCYLKLTVQPAFSADLPSATFTETTRLFVTRTGHPAAKISWTYDVPWAKTQAAAKVIEQPTSAVHRVIGHFGADMQSIVCGKRGVFGSLDAAGQFVNAGGVVIYSLSLPTLELASVRLDTCEAI
jgi:hypothetical protein